MPSVTEGERKVGISTKEREEPLTRVSVRVAAEVSAVVDVVERLNGIDI